jgi:D-glycero-beta-D-manno-heptose-7-phosphate kinase
MTAARPGELDRQIERMASARVGVVGDLVADIYISGLTERISREAPVPVIRFESQWLVPGCGANVAVNIASLGASVHVAGLVGEDQAGYDLVDTLRQRGVQTEGILFCSERPTTSKTRLLAGARHTIRQQLARLDREPSSPPPEAMRGQLLEAVGRLDGQVDAWIISDYGYHCFDAQLKAAMRSIATRKPVLADSRFDTLGFPGVTVTKPNEEEALQATGMANGGIEPMKRAAHELSRRLDVAAVLITLGNQGMLLHERHGEPRHIPAVGTDEIVDLTGAGDTVAAVFTTALAAGAGLFEAATLANAAASIVVMKEGAASATPAELVEVIRTLEA